MWGFEHDRLSPDIRTVGKGVGGGFPLSGVISTDQFCQARPYALPSGSSSSYGGNPLAAAAGLASLEIILRENLVENSRQLGALLLRKFKNFEERFEFVGEARGRGLMLGIELVKSKKTKELSTRRFAREFFMRAWSAVAFHDLHKSDSPYPPLTISQESAMRAAAILRKSLQRFRKMVRTA
jgi:4-aminobutyrate aminotransferase-like enzyme